MHSTTNSRKWLVLLAIGLGTYMTALDSSVVNTVIPLITRDLAADVAAIEWVATTYLLVVSGLLLTFGRLGDLHGHKLNYLGGFLIFLAASAGCGMAPTTGWLIGLRAVQALGGAMLYANGPAILTTTFPPQRRGLALGLQAAMTYLGLTTGPSLGGWLAESYGWRSIFYINVPVAIIAVIVGLFAIPYDRQHARQERFDLAGALIYMTGFSLLLFSLNRAYDWGWTSSLTLGLLTFSVILLTAFVFYEKRITAPMLDLSLFRSATFNAAVGSAVINYICMYSVMFLLPFFLMDGRGLSPSQSGLVLIAQPVVMAVVVPLSGSLSDKIGTRRLTMTGMAIMAAGLFIISLSSNSSPLWLTIAGLMINGLGIGVFISPNNSALMGSAPASRQGIAAGMLASARSAGMALGVGMAGAIFNTLSASGAQGAFFYAISTAMRVAACGSLLGIFVASLRDRLPAREMETTSGK
jgi:EmrB/QacA subfamily drug resistance transporter